MKFIKLLTFFTFLLQANAYCQVKIVTLSGTITDSSNNEKLANANLFLKGETDTTLKRNAISDKYGSFILKNMIPGNYTATLSHTGYITTSRKIFIYTNEEMFFRLSRSSTELADINISAEKKLLTHTTDRITYNVAESAISASGNLYDIILKIPGVAESNGALFYQGRPLLILLDNKSNNLTGEDLKSYLSGMLGANVDKLEVLLNPSSKYEAQGGAVFNIRSLKNKNHGLTKTITLGAGSGKYFRNTAGFSVNYRNSRINIYGGYDFNYNKVFNHLDAYITFNSNASAIDMLDHDVRTRNNHAVRLGMDYELNKKTSIGFLLRSGFNFRHREVLNVSKYSPGTNDPDTIATVVTTGDATFTSPSLNIFFKRQLTKSGAEITINADYFGLIKKWDDDFVTNYTDKLGNTIASPVFLLDRSPANNSVRSVMADYYQPLKNGKFEAGFKIAQSKTDNNVLWQQLHNNRWETDFSKTNHFIYKESVNAAYINVLNTFNKWSVQVGMRLEATNSDAISVTVNKVTNSKYQNLFPSVSVQYKPVKAHQLTLNYRKSIGRFGFDIINPFIILQSQYSYHQGNPYIRPSFIKSFDLSWSYKNKLVVSTGYSAVKDPMSYGYRKDINSNMSIGTYLNFPSGKLYNSNINYTEKFFKGKWTSINSIGFLHSEMPDFNSHRVHSNSYLLNTVNSIKIPLEITMEVSGFYNSPSRNGTVGQASYYGLSMGFSIPVFKSKGSLKLGCTDLFDSQIQRFNTQGNGIKIVSGWKRESRFINLLFTYRFGNLNVKANKARSTGIEDERSRMGIN